MAESTPKAKPEEILSTSDEAGPSGHPHITLPIYSTSEFNLGVYNNSEDRVAPGKARISTQHRLRRREIINDAIAQAATGHSQLEAKRFLDAASKGNKDEMVEMLNAGTDPCISDNKKRTALHVASAKGLDEIVVLLLNHGADPNQADCLGNSALHLASCTHHTRVITLLIQAGCKVDATGKSGVSPLRYASGKLNLLINDQSMHTERLRTEIRQVIELMQVYLQKGKTSTENNSINEMTTQLQSAQTRDDMDAINAMLQNISQLSLQ